MGNKCILCEAERSAFPVLFEMRQDKTGMEATSQISDTMTILPNDRTESGLVRGSSRMLETLLFPFFRGKIWFPGNGIQECRPLMCMMVTNVYNDNHHIHPPELPYASFFTL